MKKIFIAIMLLTIMFGNSKFLNDEKGLIADNNVEIELHQVLDNIII